MAWHSKVKAAAGACAHATGYITSMSCLWSSAGSKGKDRVKGSVGLEGLGAPGKKSNYLGFATSLIARLTTGLWPPTQLASQFYQVFHFLKETPQPKLLVIKAKATFPSGETYLLRDA